MTRAGAGISSGFHASGTPARERRTHVRSPHLAAASYGTQTTIAPLPRLAQA